MFSKKSMYEVQAYTMLKEPPDPMGLPNSGATSNCDDKLRISICNVGKAYQLYNRPIDFLKQQLLGRFGKTYANEFWALKNVSFDLHAGKMLGIIGRNGSGKSTLLQILAGTLQPTTGKVQTRGRVAALLELGSGFDPECSGRANVYMNGAILGISRSEMERRFDEIACFADIGEFIDQPVKTYSTGMFVRLAFAVTTSLDPDILLIDEALAVGDIFFRQKCYKRLDELLTRGVSIVLVSHAMNDVEQFCKDALILHHGEAIFQGSAPEAVKRYYLIEQQDRLVSMEFQGEEIRQGSAPIPDATEINSFWPGPEAFIDISSIPQVSNGWARCTGVAVCNSEGLSSRSFQQGEMASFFYEFEILHDIEVPIGGLVIQNDRGVLVHGKSTLEYGSRVPSAVPKDCRLRFRQDIALEIAIGEYVVCELGLATMSKCDYDQCEYLPYEALRAKDVRLCHLPNPVQFVVVWRYGCKPVQLLHHGVANLPGGCHVMTKVLF